MQDNKKKRLTLGALILGIVIIVILSIMQLVKVGTDYKAEKQQMQEATEKASQLSDATNNLQTELEEMLLQVDTMNAIMDVNKEMVVKISSTTDSSSQTLTELEQKTTNLQKVLNQYLEEYKNTVNQTNEDILNSFDEINKDLDNINNIIANDNNQRNENYKTLKESIEKTQSDVTNLLNKLSKQNKDEYKKLTEQITNFDEDLKAYMEDAKEKLLVTLDENYVQLNEHMDVVQSDLSLARQDIIDILNALAESKTSNYNEKFEALEEHLNLITEHFDAMLDELAKVINSLSEQNAQEHQKAIENLVAMQSSLTEVENSSFDKMHKEFEDARADYLKKIEELGVVIRDNFDDTQMRIENTDKYRIGVVSNAAGTINGQFADNNKEIEALNKNLQNNYNAYLDGKEADNKNLKILLNDYDSKVSKIYSTVKDGKKTLATAINGKLLNQDLYISNDATFHEMAEAIKKIPEEIIVTEPDIYKNKKLTIKAHFHEPNGTSAIKTFSSFAEYETYLKAHPASGATTSKTKGGCYSNAEHKDWEVVGTETYTETYISGYDTGSTCVNPHNVCHFTGDGVGPEGVSTNWNGWGSECHTECERQESYSVPRYSTRQATRPKYGWVAKGYYDLVCKYNQGQIISITLEDNGAFIAP